MKCLTPILLPVHHYGVVPKMYQVGIVSTDYYLVPCGKCVNCLKADQQDWALRLMLESEVSYSSWFITLTFDNEKVSKVDVIYKEDVQKFIKRLRRRYKYLSDKVRVKDLHLSYYAVGEYGRKRNRPHYHIMLFGLPVHDWRAVKKLVDDCWPYGYTSVEPCCTKTCNYVCKYMGKFDPRPHKVKPFRMMSLKPALGYTYFVEHPEVLQYLEQREIPTLRTRDGKMHRVPRSIKRKFFSLEKQNSMKNFARIDAYRCDQRFLQDYLTSIKQGVEENKRRIKKLEEKFYNPK